MTNRSGLKHCCPEVLSITVDGIIVFIQEEIVSVEVLLFLSLWVLMMYIVVLIYVCLSGISTFGWILTLCVARISLKRPTTAETCMASFCFTRNEKLMK